MTEKELLEKILCDDISEEFEKQLDDELSKAEPDYELAERLVDDILEVRGISVPKADKKTARQKINDKLKGGYEVSERPVVSERKNTDDESIKEHDISSDAVKPEKVQFKNERKKRNGIIIKIAASAAVIMLPVMTVIYTNSKYSVKVDVVDNVPSFSELAEFSAETRYIPKMTGSGYVVTDDIQHFTESGEKSLAESKTSESSYEKMTSVFSASLTDEITVSSVSAENEVSVSVTENPSVSTAISENTAKPPASTTTGTAIKPPVNTTTSVATKPSVNTTTSITTKPPVNTTSITTKPPVNTTSVTTKPPVNTTSITTKPPVNTTTSITTKPPVNTTTSVTTKPPVSITTIRVTEPPAVGIAPSVSTTYSCDAPGSPYVTEDPNVTEPPDVTVPPDNSPGGSAGASYYDKHRNVIDRKVMIKDGAENLESKEVFYDSEENYVIYYAVKDPENIIFSCRFEDEPDVWYDYTVDEITDTNCRGYTSLFTIWSLYRNSDMISIELRYRTPLEMCLKMEEKGVGKITGHSKSPVEYYIIRREKQHYYEYEKIYTGIYYDYKLKYNKDYCIITDHMIIECEGGMMFSKESDGQSYEWEVDAVIGSGALTIEELYEAGLDAERIEK